MIEERVCSCAELLEALPYSPRDIEELVGLDPGYLDEVPPDIRLVADAPFRPLATQAQAPRDYEELDDLPF